MIRFDTKSAVITVSRDGIMWPQVWRWVLEMPVVDVDGSGDGYSYSTRRFSGDAMSSKAAWRKARRALDTAEVWRAQVLRP